MKKFLHLVLIVVAGCACALGLRLLLTPLLQDQSPFVTFLLIVLLLGRYGGLWTGVAATALSIVLAECFLQVPLHSVGPSARAQIVPLANFIVLGTLMSILNASWRSAERSARESEDYLSRIVEIIDDVILVISATGRITYANQAAAKLVGIPAMQIVGQRHRNFAQYCHVSFGEKTVDGDTFLLQVLHQEHTVRGVSMTVWNMLGNEFFLCVNATPLKGPDGKGTGIVLCATLLSPAIALGIPNSDFSASSKAEAPPVTSAKRSSQTSKVSQSWSGKHTGDLWPKTKTASNPEAHSNNEILKLPALKTNRSARILYLDHTAKMSGGEIALMRLLPALDSTAVKPLVVLAEGGPLFDQLIEMGVETYIIALGDRVRDIRKDTLTTLSLGRVRALAETLIYGLKLAQFARSHNVDLIHTNSLKAHIYGGIAGLWAGVPIVWHVRDYIDSSYLPPPIVTVFRLLVRIVPNFVIANSESTRAQLHLRRKRTSVVIPSGIFFKENVVHDGLMQQALTYGSSRSEHIWPDVVRIGIVGRLTPWKGQHIFLKAAAHVIALGHQARFVIVGSPMFGEDTYEEALRELVRELNLESYVQFLGFQSNIPAVLHDLDILVHASISPEPFGQVVIEGMAERLPVIGTDAGGIREIIKHGENGLLFPLGDVHALAQAIDLLLTDHSLAQRLADAGFAHVHRNFTIQQTARRIEEVYSYLLSSKCF